MKNFTPPVFNFTENWKDFLESEGYVVICNILEQSVINTGIEHFWKDWNTVSPGFVRNDPSTWSINTAPMMFAKGMAIFNGFGQCDFMWFLRTQQPIIDIFSEIHRTKDLITSFDGFSVFFSKKQKSPKDWFHIDQHPTNQVYCIQGAYNFFPVCEDSAGFTVVPGSHRTFVPEPTLVKKDWIQLHSNKSPDEATEILKPAVKLIIPGNCFVLWNSKTIHANTGMTCKTDPGELNRLTAYITFVPKNWRTEPKILEDRKAAYIVGHATSHWPNKVQLKMYPWGFGPMYQRRGFKSIQPNRDIPEERLGYI